MLLRKASWWLLLLLAPALGACAQPPVPQDTFYRLEVGAPEMVLSALRFQGTLEIERLSADGLTAGRPSFTAQATVPGS